MHILLEFFKRDNTCHKSSRFFFRFNITPTILLQIIFWFVLVTLRIFVLRLFLEILGGLFSDIVKVNLVFTIMAFFVILLNDLDREALCFSWGCQAVVGIMPFGTAVIAIHIAGDRGSLLPWSFRHLSR